MNLDFDRLPQPTIDELVRVLEDAAKRLRTIVLEPPGTTAGAVMYNQARAAQQLAQVNDILAAARKRATRWTSTALRDAFQAGIATAGRQLRDSGVEVAGDVLKGNFSLVNTRALEVLARDTVSDIIKALDGAGAIAGKTLRQMAATGVTKQEVNQILAGRAIIEGKPRESIRELKAALVKVHGETVTVTDKNGDPRTFDAGDYAEMVARTKTREAVVTARHETFADNGIDLVIVVGRVSKNFCSGYLGKVFSLSGKDPDYPALDDLPGGGPPFHPNCSKSTAPFIRELVTSRRAKAAAPDDQLDQMMSTTDRSKLQRIFKDHHGAGAAADRSRNIVEEIRAKARAAGYEPPANGLAREGR